ncbi:phosphatidate cytidylyltransferase [Desulfuromonas sp. KJ2020]|uniref:phosphatidate cytidylyltransferase n=1 Tax=Desulfuromonas sp. KJ2020 TaxID=2919173 RepID=UPI0035325578
MLTALVALPLLVLFIIYASPMVFNVLVFGVGLLALHEFYGMALSDGRQKIQLLAVVGGSFLLIPFALGNVGYFQGWLVFLLLFFAVAFLFSFRDLTRVVQEMGLVMLGLLYIPLLLGHLMLLRDLPFGREWIFFALLCIMACDSAAYFIGSALGRRKLYPAISPNKSVEGALGGVAGTFVGAGLAKIFFFQELSWSDVVLLGGVLGVLGQLGDLFESMLKRSFNVKDSGTLIPGHGGILDRLDSLLFAFAPVYYYAFLFFKG